MRGNIGEFEGSGPPRPAQQIARIAALLGELEELSYAATDVPLSLLKQTRASIANARSVLKTCVQVARSAATEVGRDGDPQPDVDSDLLERMYRTLGVGRRPPER
jgi:hypothetical protein